MYFSLLVHVAHHLCECILVFGSVVSNIFVDHVTLRDIAELARGQGNTSCRLPSGNLEILPGWYDICGNVSTKST